MRWVASCLGGKGWEMACGNGSLLQADKMSCAYEAVPVKPEEKSRAVALTDLENC